MGLKSWIITCYTVGLFRDGCSPCNALLEIRARRPPSICIAAPLARSEWFAGLLFFLGSHEPGISISFLSKIVAIHLLILLSSWNCVPQLQGPTFNLPVRQDAQSEKKSLSRDVWQFWGDEFILPWKSNFDELDLLYWCWILEQAKLLMASLHPDLLKN